VGSVVELPIMMHFMMPVYRQSALARSCKTMHEGLANAKVEFQVHHRQTASESGTVDSGCPDSPSDERCQFLNLIGH